MSGGRRKHRQGSRDAWIPWLFVGLFGIVLAANGALAYFAISSFTGLETEGHYEKGLEYNRVLAAERRQDALGWSVYTDFRPNGGNSGRLVVSARDRRGTPLRGAAVTARLIRPTQSGYDREITLAPAGVGSYEAEVDLPLKGQWDIQTRIEHRSDTYLSVERIVTP